jgi:hypothetical protein
MNDDQFNQLAKQISGTKNDLGDQILKLYQHFDERIDKLEAELAVKADGERVYRALDGIAKRLDTDDAERAAMNNQLDRHDRWHHQTADKLGLKLDYQQP